MFINIVNQSTTFRLEPDIGFVCTHEDAEIEKACCPAGTRDCGCYGSDSISCPAVDCTGIQDDEVERLFEERS